jgi:RNase P/RNase MRP subunit p30
MFEDSTRVICMTNIINIIKATKGKNLIISSHSNSVYKHRTPYDVASLLITLGMNKNQTLTCMKENP